jgi:uncharacterized membrane protein
VAHLNLKTASFAGVIAAVYIVLSLTFAPISFGVYQVRVSEALTVLPFLTPAAVPGLFVGVLVANNFGGIGWVDVVFGSLLTLLAALGTRGMYHLSRTAFSNIVALLAPVLLWGCAFVTLVQSTSELIALFPAALSVGCLWWMEKRRAAGKQSRSASVTLLVGSFVLLLLAISVFRLYPEITVMLLGAVAMLGGWMITWVLIYVWTRGHNPNVVLAPLPPVLINAFGVAVYLAPATGYTYWFAVQMIGIGQLIACYVLGLPLLLVLEKRRTLLG